MTNLFAPAVINQLHLPNRFVRSATWEGLATPVGHSTPPLNETMARLARGGVGLIITGYAYVRPDGQSGPGQLGAYDEHCVPSLRTMTEAVHAAGGRIALQIVHGGLFANPEFTHSELLGPSTNPNAAAGDSRALSLEKISQLTKAFTQAAVRAQRAGFDAVQIHAAHGFLLNQFLAPQFNRRTDDYGGSLTNRARFLIEVVQSIRTAVGPNFPVLVKLNSEDFIEQGLTREEAMTVAAWLEAASVDAIELSGGTVASPENLIPARPGKPKRREDEVYYLDAARLYKQRVKIPLMLVGGIRSYSVAAELIATGITDFISLGRPLVCEPDLVERWQDGDRRDSECGSCNGCFAPAGEGRGAYCVPLEKKRVRARQDPSLSA